MSNNGFLLFCDGAYRLGIVDCSFLQFFHCWSCVVSRTFLLIFSTNCLLTIPITVLAGLMSLHVSLDPYGP